MMLRENLRENAAGWKWENSYSQLPDLFYQRTLPQPVREAAFLVFNHALAAELGLNSDFLAKPAHADFLAGNEIPKGADPLAQAYAGHQFGHFNGLGDGRAILLGEHISPDGRKWDIQLKGAGRTAYSRGGDGRAAVAPMLREYLMSEAMTALGIPSTRSLAVVSTGERIQRQTLQLGAILTRVAASHIRVGTFQWAAAHQDPAALRALWHYTASRHFPEIDPADPLRFFSAAMESQIDLVVHWMRVGFVHGVMNTDNMALSGETIDYGPCAFMDAYDPKTVFSSIDHGGRYAFGNQPSIVRWNLARLAETLLPLIHEERARAVDEISEVLKNCEGLFQQKWLAMMRQKLGLITQEDEDGFLIEDLLERMQKVGADYTNTFRVLSQKLAFEASPFSEQLLCEWHVLWMKRQAGQGQEREKQLALMRASNPAVIPRNHGVEAALDQAKEGNSELFHELLKVLATPYEETSSSLYTSPAPAGSEKYVTYCGT